MIYTVLCSYLFGWVVTTIGLALTIDEVLDEPRALATTAVSRS